MSAAVGSSSASSGFRPPASSSGITEKNQEATVYVGNLDERITEPLLWELFVQVAVVVSIHIPRDRINQTHLGYGFVELQNDIDAEYASKILHGIKVFGKPLKVNRATADRRNLDVGANLFIGNLDTEVDEALLQETFKTFGTIISVKIAREGEGGTGPSRGFGFVSFDGFEASDGAIEAMNGQYLCNRPITVSYAFKKDGKGERHGTAAERLLAAQAKKSGLLAPAVTTPTQQQSTMMNQMPFGMPMMPYGSMPMQQQMMMMMNPQQMMMMMPPGQMPMQMPPYPMQQQQHHQQPGYPPMNMNYYYPPPPPSNPPQ